MNIECLFKHLPRNAIETRSGEALDKVLLKDLASYRFVK